MKTKQPKVKMQKYTLLDFEKQFPNDDVCLEWLKNYLYPDGMDLFLESKIISKSHSLQHYQMLKLKVFVFMI
jgi:hypothetical protein